MTKTIDSKDLGKPRMDYQEQVKQNEWVFMETLKRLRPDLWMIADLLKDTNTNYLILVHVLRHLYNIASGSKFGTVTVDVQNGIATFVKGEESNRLNEPIILPEKLV